MVSSWADLHPAWQHVTDSGGYLREKELQRTFQSTSIQPATSYQPPISHSASPQASDSERAPQSRGRLRTQPEAAYRHLPPPT
ncbi:hypothetical protein GN956_G11155 [Arapaima gigas]